MLAKREKIPEAAIRRLPVYLRELDDLIGQQVEVTSSADLAARTGFSSEQIRKDLAYFGAFGTRGVGYDTALLSSQIKRILRLHHGVRVALVGAGHLGTAFARYSRQVHKDVRISAVFDRDRGRIGLPIVDLTVQPMEELEETILRERIRMGVVAVPAASAQEVLDRLAAAGVEAVLNFSPAKLHADGVTIQNIDLTMELQSLAYYTSEEADGETP